ncbi:MAG: acyltransferase [Acidobacteriia bacterium]|nr:acyltransferase [Terriglobia bacterium]
MSVVPSSGRIPALDGWRGIAILLVLLWHSVFHFSTSSTLISKLEAAGRLSWSGVDLFFVLSGFLIGGILLDAKNSPRYFSTFYARRAFRILPLYGVVVAAYMLWQLPVYLLAGATGAYSASRLPLASYLTFTQNVWMAYLGTFGFILISPTWSLAVEEQFYLTAPLIVRKLTSTQLTTALVGIVVGAPVLRTILCFSTARGAFADMVPMPCRADALCVGVLIAVLLRNATLWKAVQRKSALLYSLSGVLLASLGWLTFGNYGQISMPMMTVGYSLLALFYGCCLLLALNGAGRSQRLLCNPYLRGLGGIAYCTYLLHRPLMEVARRLLAARFSQAPGAVELIGGLLGVAATLVIAKLSWRFFEQPWLRRGHAFKY